MSRLKSLTDVEFTINYRYDTKFLRNIQERSKALVDFEKLLYYVFLNQKVPTHRETSPFMGTEEVDKVDFQNECNHFYQDKSISFENGREGKSRVYNDFKTN